MTEFIDISLEVSPDLPKWPGSPDIVLERRLDLKRGDACNDSLLSCSVHTGTHVDAPSHFIAEGAEVSQLPIDVFVGRAVVALLADAAAVTASDLEGLSLPEGIERLLLRTRNSNRWATKPCNFDSDFVALTPDAAHWLVARGIRLIGVDYLSVEPFGDSYEVHHILLGAGVAIVEGLNLANVPPAEYELICVPLRLADAEASPVRAVLRCTRER